jgi:hypothetical protein
MAKPLFHHRTGRWLQGSAWRAKDLMHDWRRDGLGTGGSVLPVRFPLQPLVTAFLALTIHAGITSASALALEQSGANGR